MDTTYNSLDSGNLPKGCGCDACMNASSGVLDNDTANNNDVYAPTINATKEQFSDYLINGFWNDFGGGARQWNTSTDNIISYSLSNQYTAAQKAGFRIAFESWSDVADITFSEVNSGADINVVRGNDGRAYSSSSVYGDGSGDIASNTISIDTSA